jgi:hypothetical protein
MNEPKTQCATCGTSILKRTAEKNFGLCAPCYQKARSTPPDTFEMPHELVQRIVSMGEDPDWFRQDAWRHGTASVHQQLDWLEQAAADYRRWSPVLRAFAIERRRISPSPAVEGLDAAARAQHSVLHAKMSEFAATRDGLVTLAPRPHQLAVLSTNRIGLPAAEKLFGGSGAVILEESERRYWFSDVFADRREGPWWYVFAWWTIQDGLDSVHAERIRGRHLTAQGHSWWVTESGVQWGPLAGGCHQELWRWDGAQVEFIEMLAHLSF